jgi:hypothetical protein
MPAILQEGATLQCTHGGTVSPVNTNTKVKVGGTYALLAADTFTVAGCPFTLPNGTPMPCVTVEWQLPTNMVKVGGQAVLLETSIGLCKAATQAVQGTAIVSGAQTNVKGV